MLTVGDKFPSFALTAATTNDISGFKTISSEDASGQWSVYFAWPKDFTFVCPTEISGYGDLYEEFKNRGCEVYGFSTDSEFVHMAWRNDHPALNNLPFAMLADIKRELSIKLGILDQNEGVCLRATYIVDPEGTIRHVSVNDLSVGRSPSETLRILDGLQNGGLIPCEWKKGDDTLKIA